MKGFILSFVAALFCTTTSWACEQPIVVLVPGFFNLPAVEYQLGLANQNSSLIEYFSNDVLDAIKNKGFKTIILRNLNPIGAVRVNGEIVRKDLEQLEQSYPNCPLQVIAHSAGGLYLANALTSNPKLNIKTVVTISTPYEGAELVDLVSWIPGWDAVADFISLESLVEFDENRAKIVLSQLRVPQQIRWIALGAHQEPCNLLSCSDPRQISWLLSVAWNFTPSVGDGVVTLASATLKNWKIASDDGNAKNIERWSDFIVPLEHWEMFVDANLFDVIGVKDTTWISTEQNKFISTIVERAFLN